MALEAVKQDQQQSVVVAVTLAYVAAMYVCVRVYNFAHLSSDGAAKWGSVL